MQVTIDRRHELPISSNLLSGAFMLAEPDKVFVCDITYIHTEDGWLLLAVLIELFICQVMCWSLRHEMKFISHYYSCLAHTCLKWHSSKQTGLLF